MFVIFRSFQFLNYTKYVNASEYLDRPLNITEFPSSYFLQCHDEPKLFTKETVTPLCMSDQQEEEMIFDLTDEEFENRKKYQYVYNRRGQKWYSVHDGYLHYERRDSKRDCMWKFYKGKCIIHTMHDDLYHIGHVIVNFEFIPLMAKQLASDLNESFLVDYYNPGYDFIVKSGIRVGNVYECDKRKLLKGEEKCGDHDYDFHHFERIYELEDKAK
ncbi:Conserved_hypothetical protein [Hexamita inflata]|uniref:Uncharacterized protein n=1 Tax=Hexamita inflata TaxID=28002 RepID=A0AA86TW65_9EUKA|nr:Conserved hypothetical protein [Hexamita inflata]CAI9938409.1 Conserved hypothetical protein [Hexamita inflata]CAI9947035.1 Conserved hypothetical protein [Hexamita inflata]